MDRLPCCEGCKTYEKRICMECANSADKCVMTCVRLNGSKGTTFSRNWVCRHTDRCRRAYRSRDAEMSDALADYGSAIELLTKRTQDRDRWRRRAEALEMALKDVGGSCATCTRRGTAFDPCRECAGDNDESVWEFDEARYARGGGSDG